MSRCPWVGRLMVPHFEEQEGRKALGAEHLMFSLKSWISQNIMTSCRILLLQFMLERSDYNSV